MSVHDLRVDIGQSCRGDAGHHARREINGGDLRACPHLGMGERSRSRRNVEDPAPRRQRYGRKRRFGEAGRERMSRFFLVLGDLVPSIGVFELSHHRSFAKVAMPEAPGEALERAAQRYPSLRRYSVGMASPKVGTALRSGDIAAWDLDRQLAVAASLGLRARIVLEPA